MYPTPTLRHEDDWTKIKFFHVFCAEMESQAIRHSKTLSAFVQFMAVGI